jgi:hypothetical protein
VRERACVRVRVCMHVCAQGLKSLFGKDNGVLKQPKDGDKDKKKDRYCCNVLCCVCNALYCLATRCAVLKPVVLRCNLQQEGQGEQGLVERNRHGKLKLNQRNQGDPVPSLSASVVALGACGLGRTFKFRSNWPCSACPVPQAGLDRPVADSPLQPRSPSLWPGPRPGRACRDGGHVVAAGTVSPTSGGPRGERQGRSVQPGSPWRARGATLKLRAQIRGHWQRVRQVPPRNPATGKRAPPRWWSCYSRPDGSPAFHALAFFNARSESDLKS